MSRKKHNVSYIKPDEPKFLRVLKEQIEYKQGPTVDTKREIIPVTSDDDEKEEMCDEKPVVVVLNSGDLTAEEADTFKKRKEEEESSTPADLSKKIIFRKTRPLEVEPDTDTADKPIKKKARKTKRSQRAVLSFDTSADDADDIG